MATPITFTLGTSQKVCFLRDDGSEPDTTEGMSEDCALSVTYQFAEGDDLEAVVREKADEVGALHAEAQKHIRLASAARKANPVPEPVISTSRPAQFPPPEETNIPPLQTNGKSEPPITRAQCLAIEDHFCRLGYTEQQAYSLIRARFGKLQIEELSMRQASALMAELQRTTVDPRSDREVKERARAAANGRHGSKR